MSDEQQQGQQKRLHQQQEQMQIQQHKMCNNTLASNGGSGGGGALALPTTTTTARASPTTAIAIATTRTPPPSSGGGRVATAANGGAQTGSTAPRKTQPHELRNSEFVSRLMAATPPYLYSAPVGPNNFFFSDMLRSLVQARNNENVRNLQLQQSIIARRSRKRSWSSQHRTAATAYVEHMREGNKPAPLVAMPMAPLTPQQLAPAQQLQQELNNSGSAIEKPLELTNKATYFLGGVSKYHKPEESSGGELECEKKLSISETHVDAEAAESNGGQPMIGAGAGRSAVDSLLQDTPSAASLPPHDAVLPPPPIWYPPHLYPPYGIDPLHFFIDLRVSSHIYDRKKENLSPLTTATVDNNQSNNNNSNEAAAAYARASATLPLQLPQKYRQGSAFSVPVPRGANERKPAAAAAAINLSSKFEHYTKYYDFGEEKEKENQPTSLPQPPQPPPPTVAASYMLQQLPRLYSQFAAGQAVAAVAHAATASDADADGDGDNKSDADCDADSDIDGGANGDVQAISGGGTGGNCDRDIDVEFIDSIQRSIKYRRGYDTGESGDGAGGGGSSRCSSGDESSITQID